MTQVVLVALSPGDGPVNNSDPTGMLLESPTVTLPTTLYRFGTDWESAEKLQADAENAAANGFPFGVSTTARRPTRPAASEASVAELVQHFDVEQTGRDPNHFTVLLPNPVTDQAAVTFNTLFGRTPPPASSTFNPCNEPDLAVICIGKTPLPSFLGISYVVGGTTSTVCSLPIDLFSPEPNSDSNYAYV